MISYKTFVAHNSKSFVFSRYPIKLFVKFACLTMLILIDRWKWVKIVSVSSLSYRRLEPKAPAFLLSLCGVYLSSSGFILGSLELYPSAALLNSLPQVKTSLTTHWLIHLMGWLSKIFKCSDHKVLDGHSDWRYGAETAETHQSASLVSIGTLIKKFILSFWCLLTHGTSSIKLLQSLNIWNVRWVQE